MPDLFENPAGTDGFAFVEFCHTDVTVLDTLFRTFGFAATGRHRARDVTLYRQGDICFLLNDTPAARAFAAARGGGGAMGMGFRVKDSGAALQRALDRGAALAPDLGGPSLPAIEGIGGSALYFVEGDGWLSGFDSAGETPTGAGLTYLDHLTHNVRRGQMGTWADFYTRIFNFREIRYFDIEGKLTGLKSKAMTSSCGKIRIPINESSDDKSQIEEFLTRYHGEGIQHIALGTNDIYATVAALQKSGVAFQATPDSYYKKTDARVPGHGEDLTRMQALNILVDGAPTKGQGLLLQIFTKDAIGPIFFEIIQRKGNEGFGEGNFQALFESLEEDQVRRGVLLSDQ